MKDLTQKRTFHFSKMFWSRYSVRSNSKFSIWINFLSETGTIRNSPIAAAHKIAIDTGLLCVCKYDFVYKSSILVKALSPPPPHTMNLIFLLYGTGCFISWLNTLAIVAKTSTIFLIENTQDLYKPLIWVRFYNHSVFLMLLPQK